VNVVRDGVKAANQRRDDLRRADCGCGGALGIRIHNPLILPHSAPVELHAWVDRYRPIHNCLAAGDIPVTSERADLYELSALFLTMAGGFISPDTQSGDGRGYLLTFQDIQDPAVIALRDEVGLSVPDGYIYIWLYPSRESMPPALQNFFANPDIRGVTVLTRYIIVIDQLEGLNGSSGSAQRSVQLIDWLRNQRSRTLSHEFVHAYVKSALGPEIGFTLPKWYDEGLAIYLSGSSQPTAVTYHDESGQVVSWTSAPEDYARYRDQFQYMERMYGRDRFIELIRQSLINNNPALLYQELGAISENELYNMAEADRMRRSLTRVAIFAGVPAAGVLILVFIKVVGPLLLALFPIFHSIRFPVRRGKSAEDVIWMKTRGNIRGLTSLLRYTDTRHPQEAMYIRYTAVESLIELGDPAVVEYLIEALNDESSVVRASAARGLGSLVNTMNRSQILAALFPAFERETAHEVCWAAAEAIYQAGGQTVLRPLEAAIRRWLRNPSNEAAHHWFVEWAAKNRLFGPMIDLYPWLHPPERQAVADYMSQELYFPI
jgi:hypothetical protein